MFKAKARLEYHNSWIIAKCEDSLMKYYRWWFWKSRHIWVMPPKWGAHISLVRGNEEKDPKEFLFMHERENPWIEFNYSNLIEEHDDGYVWMPVWGEDLNEVRVEAGLKRDPVMPFHMTVGKIDKNYRGCK